MASIFTKRDDHVSKPNRNTFNRSFTNNLTLPIGKYVPCFCKEVISDQSVRIKPTFGFNLMPLVTPVQSRIRMNLHFFYVRNRPLWRGWMDFYGDTENPDNDTEPPYVKFTEDNQNRLKTGDLFDYFGIPTVQYLTNDVLSNPAFELPSFLSGDSSEFGFIYMSSNTSIGSLSILPLFDRNLPLESDITNIMNEIDVHIPQYELSPSSYGYLYYRAKLSFSPPYNMYPADRIIINTNVLSYFNLFEQSDYVGEFSTLYDNHLVFALIDRTTNEVYKRFTVHSNSIDFTPFSINKDEFDNDIYISNNDIVVDISDEIRYKELDLVVLLPYYITSSESLTISEINLSNVIDSVGDEHSLTKIVFSSTPIEVYRLPLNVLNYYNTENSDGVKISSLPLRAYESIYNSFYRDDRNNPLVYNGKEIYNKYIPSDLGGEDTHIPELFNANWMPDVFTTAVQSPQQGVMPLVGVTATGRMTFQDENGKSYYLNANLSDDGELTGIESYSSDMPVGTLHSMVDLISTGISINDFRNVNALQRWLEKNMRRGYHYADIIKSHFGNDIAYKDANLPEFIGGMSRVVDINKVVATAETDIPLGSIAGIGNVFGDTDAYISHFCDEPGWIIGIISVTPEPAYSQLLDKQLLKRSVLDYYFPEFAHIGFQPILNQELTPLQCSDTVGKRLTDVFGYQRAWYEYLTANDEIHGEYRTTMRNYVIQRLFKDVPELSEQFLTIDGNVANSVFADNNDSDKIFGQIYFDFVTKLPMPKYGIPRLEA